MKKILIIANYRKSIGGISGQVEILLEKYNNIQLFNTSRNNLYRLFLLFPLLFRAVRFDIIHIHACSYRGFYPAIIGILAGKIVSKEIFLTYHGGDFDGFINKHRIFLTFILKKVNKIIVPSNFLKDSFNNSGLKATVIENVLREDNVSLLSRETIKPLFTTTRAHSKVYNISMLIKAFVYVKEKYPNARLRLIGDGPLRGNLEKLVMHNGLNNSVEFTGRIRNADIGKELNKSDIYINPTTKDSFSVSMFEAFACGLPVISTNVGAIPEFLEDEINGLLVESNNHQMLADKMVYIIENQKKSKQLIKNGYETFRKHTWPILKVKYDELYNY